MSEQLLAQLATLMQERTAVDTNATVQVAPASDVQGLAGQTLHTTASADSTPVTHKGKTWHKVPTDIGITAMQHAPKGAVVKGQPVAIRIGGWPFTV